MPGHGGRRPGSGRPSKFATEQKQVAAKEKLSAADKEEAAALEAALQNIYQSATKGERWAVQWLAEHKLGRATAKVQQTADTEIYIIKRFPDTPMKCPQCGFHIESSGSSERSHPADLRLQRGDHLAAEDEGDRGDSDGSGEADALPDPAEV